ncbi:MAG: hypothetical protein GXO80_04330 [Chlorobi bacterium]|nr:hypothetical protein [Chlorobiota bacterium]
MATKTRIKVEQLFNVSLLFIIENDLKCGNSYIIEFTDGKEVEIEDLAAFKSFLKDRKIE